MQAGAEIAITVSLSSLTEAVPAGIGLLIVQPMNRARDGQVWR